MKARRVISIRVIVTLTTAALVAAAVVGAGAVSERNTRSALSREIEARLLLEARNLALTSSGALLSEFPELTLAPLVREMHAARPELAFAVVLDHRGLVQGHADLRRLGESFTLPQGLEPAAGERLLQPGERLLANSALLVAEAQVSHPSQANIGRVVVALQRSYVESAVSAARRAQLVYLAALLGIGVVIGLVVVGWLLRPVAALRIGLERIGRGDLDTPLPVRDHTELGMLAESVNDMAQRLKTAREEAVERERLQHELGLARDIQQRLLPRGPRSTRGYRLAGAQRAAAEVGGDYYDFLDLPDGRVAVAIADVSGKGLGGCLVTSMLSALLRALHGIHRSPSALLTELERMLTPTLEPGEFVTMFYGLLDPHLGRLVYASAGHTPLLVWRAAQREVEWHPTRGIPLGAVRGGVLGQTLEDRELVLGKGDLLLQFTDGISEAFDRTGKEAFGFERVDRLVLAHASFGPEALIEAVSRNVADWRGGEPQDDETLLVVAREGSAAMAADTDGATLIRSDPLLRLAEAEARGVPLTLPASLEALRGLGAWLVRCPDLAELDDADRRPLELALYEACANVAEHGLKLDPTQPFDLWWVPAVAQAAASPDPVARVRAGYFVLRDRGFPFSPGRWRPRDLDDPDSRMAGRGLGLDLIHLAMDEVVYRPATPAGNITLLTFDPAKARRVSKEDLHG